MRVKHRTLVSSLLLVVAALALQAHVTIAPSEVPAGSSQRFTVRVPSERPEPTVKVRLELPATLGNPRFLAKPGWTYELEKDAGGKVTAVTWSGGEIGPDEFDEFVFIARAPARTGPISFRSDQTYRSGETVAWAGPPGDGAPAPLVEVRDSTFGTTPPAPPTGATVGSDAADGGEGGDWMGVGALALSSLALLLSVVGLTRRS
jgi:uncharacterized protein YcnI